MVYWGIPLACEYDKSYVKDIIIKQKRGIETKSFFPLFLCLVPVVRVSLMFPTDPNLWYSKGVVREAVLLNLENLIFSIL